MIALLVITDGRRDCITQTLASASEMLSGPITRRVMYDDSGDEIHRGWLRATFPEFEVIHHPLGRQGFGGAIRTAWRHLATTPEPYIFHLEDDFTFNHPVPLIEMGRVLDSNPHLVQLALRRQPWNDTERRAGGIVESHPDAYDDCHDMAGHHWLEQRLFFTTNPSLYRSELCQNSWPDCDHSEGVFSHQLMQDAEVRFGYWGSRDSGEWVTHIGHERVGTGY